MLGRTFHDSPSFFLVMGYAFIGAAEVGGKDVDDDIVVNVVVVTVVVTFVVTSVAVVTVVVFGSLPPSMRGVAKNKRITKWISITTAPKLSISAIWLYLSSSLG